MQLKCLPDKGLVGQCHGSGIHISSKKKQKLGCSKGVNLYLSWAELLSIIPLYPLSALRCGKFGRQISLSLSRGMDSSPRSGRGTLLRAGHSGSFGVQIQCTAGWICLQDHKFLRVCVQCSGLHCGTFSTLFNAFLPLCLPPLLCRIRVEGVTNPSLGYIVNMLMDNALIFCTHFPHLTFCALGHPYS